VDFGSRECVCGVTQSMCLCVGAEVQGEVRGELFVFVCSCVCVCVSWCRVPSACLAGGVLACWRVAGFRFRSVEVIWTFTPLHDIHIRHHLRR
jgi:hypothetical protein